MTIDRQILDNQILRGIAKIREEFGSGLHEALDMFARRYERLRRERPGDFAVDAETYWKGFYS
ncbi:hypothetical protein I6A84_09915 [Frankia sp. CNm7]|nr:hypothetical protein [Frankia nepalensis]MBL7511212.1 hypothetical protein [Frankia nepalensis]MBL7518418.1 hypothetical protein [Frankia nepalensis]